MSYFTVGSQNAWSGCVSANQHDDAVVEYICVQAQKFEVFALQEVHEKNSGSAKRFMNMGSPGHRPGPIDIELGNRLRAELQKSHNCFFTHHFLHAYHDYQRAPEDLKLAWGNMLLIKKSVEIVKAPSAHPIYGYYNISTEKGVSGRPASRVMQVVTVVCGGLPLTIANIHGLHTKKGKGDIPARTAQSSAIMNGVRLHQKSMEHKPPVILIGDFNYLSTQQAMTSLLEKTEIFGTEGSVNLNVKFNVNDTRTRWYPKNKPHREADYALISAALLKQVQKFKVIRAHVPSDHARLEVILSQARS